MRSLLLSIVISCFFFHASAQSLTWWANNVHWDGITPWERYIIIMPGYLGPNALPVPAITNGSIDCINSIGISGNAHFSKEDHTQNISLYANYCLVRNKISFDLFWVPLEHFTMSHRLKEERKVFALKYYDTHATGDIHLNARIQLINSSKKNLQAALRIGYCLPSSTGLGVARFSDAPGFYFDVSFNKGFMSIPGLKWITMLGAYFWECDNVTVRHRQEDAFLFGTGLEWNKGSYKIQGYISGYLGYLQNLRDDPIVARIKTEKIIKQKTLFFQLQQGLHDFKYSSAEIGMKFCFKEK